MRIYFDGASKTVVDGPFTEAKELIAGVWLSRRSRSRTQALPILRPGVVEQVNIEIRRVFEAEDFGEPFTT